MNPSIILDAIRKDLKRLRAEIEHLQSSAWSDAARTYAKITVAKAQIEIMDDYRDWLESTITEGGAK